MASGIRDHYLTAQAYESDPLMDATEIIKGSQIVGNGAESQEDNSYKSNVFEDRRSSIPLERQFVVKAKHRN